MINLEDMAQFLERYDVVFFKGGIIEVAFIKRFVDDDILLVNMETLGCPAYDQLVRNLEFLKVTELAEDNIQSCQDHVGQAQHCATSEVAVFG